MYSFLLTYICICIREYMITRYFVLPINSMASVTSCTKEKQKYILMCQVTVQLFFLPQSFKHVLASVFCLLARVDYLTLHKKAEQIKTQSIRMKHFTHASRVGGWRKRPAHWIERNNVQDRSTGSSARCASVDQLIRIH